jgi:hypothetical protein
MRVNHMMPVKCSCGKKSWFETGHSQCPTMEFKSFYCNSCGCQASIWSGYGQGPILFQYSDSEEIRLAMVDYVHNKLLPYWMAMDPEEVIIWPILSLPPKPPVGVTAFIRKEVKGKIGSKWSKLFK